ncbi:hypothetical protein ACLMJK_009046 [Lecanora helva]
MAMLSQNPIGSKDAGFQAGSFLYDNALSSDSVVILPKNFNDLLCSGHQKLTRLSQYRNSRTGGTRSTRTQIDHDVFEGLPVRHWRKRPIGVSTAPEKETMNDVKARNLALPELEMPRDSHLLSEMSQNLLRAARMPQAKKSLIMQSAEDDKEAGEEEDVGHELETGFFAKRWAVVPKDMEGPEPEFLAKRRKGLPSIHGGVIAALGSSQQMRKTKIRKVDGSGESSVLEVLVPEGQTVDGEIFEEETSPVQAPAPGTIVEGIGVVNADGVVIAVNQAPPTNNRRKPPLPKKRNKGPGRGKKKKVAFAGADGKPTSTDVNGVTDGVTGIEGQPTGDAQGVSDHEKNMGDGLTLREGEEGSEESSESEEGEEGDREEGELSPSASSQTPPPHEVPHTVSDETEVGGDEKPASTGLQPIEADSTFTENHSTIMTEPSVISTVEETVDADYQPISGGANDENQMQVDEPTKEISQNTPNAIIGEIVPAPVIEVGPQLGEDMSIAPTGSSGDEISEKLQVEVEPEPEPEPQPQPQPQLEPELVANSQPAAEAPSERAFAESTKPPVQEQSSEVTASPPQEPMKGPVGDVLQESDAHEFEQTRADVMPGPAEEEIQDQANDSRAHLSAEPPMEPVQQGILDPAVQSNVISEPAVPAEDGSISQRTSYFPQTSEDSRDVSSQQRENEEDKETSKVFPASLPGLILQPTPPVEVEPLSTPQPPITEVPLATMTEVAPTPASSVPKIVDVPYEPPITPAERRFSYTRPTISPKAPTPSPPTPIEEKPRPPQDWLNSPKAPTMSPPTPLDRSMPSSPDISLAEEQQFTLPPPVDPVQSKNLAPVPDMQHISDSNRLTVEAAPQVEPRVNTQIPVEHDPLDGMAEPKLAHPSHNDTGEGEQKTHFSDGEEDLLGSLERSLNQRSHGE